MAEEHRCEAPEGHRLCANNCGFFESSATMNLCSNCYRVVCLKEQQQASIKSTVENSLSSSSTAETVESLPSPAAASSEIAGDVSMPPSPAAEGKPVKASPGEAKT